MKGQKVNANTYNDGQGPELDAIIVAAAMMHPNVPGCDATEPKVCDVCHEAATALVQDVVPGVVANMLTQSEPPA